MEVADSAHSEELRDDIGPRERRDAAIGALHDRVSRVRGTVEHAELVASLGAVYADRRRAETTFRLKQEALDTHNRTYTAVTSILAGLYRLSGLDAYDERLRPTVPQSAAVEVVEEELEDAPMPDGEVELPEPAPLARVPAGRRPGRRHRCGGRSHRDAVGQSLRRLIRSFLRTLPGVGLTAGAGSFVR